jgi:hypothetical protein
MTQPAATLTEADLDILLSEPFSVDSLAILRAQFCGPEIIDDRLHGAFISKAMRVGRAGGPEFVAVFKEAFATYMLHGYTPLSAMRGPAAGEARP